MTPVIIIATAMAMIASQKMRERHHCGCWLRGGGRLVGMAATIAARVLHVQQPPSAAFQSRCIRVRLLQPRWGTPMSARKTVHVTCHDCGMSAEVRLDTFGLRYYVTDIGSHSKCKYDWRGMSALGCSGLKPELLKARASLAQEDRLSA